MRIRDWVVSQKELVSIGALVGALGAWPAVRGPATTPIAARPAAEVPPDSFTRQDVRRLSRDVSVVASRVTVVGATLDALLRVECIKNTRDWSAYELAGIRCGELVPSTVQAGRGRR